MKKLIAILILLPTIVWALGSNYVIRPKGEIELRPANKTSAFSDFILEGTSLTVKEQSLTPSNPAATYKKIYCKDNGKCYQLDSAGNEKELGAGAGGGGGFNSVLVCGDMECDVISTDWTSNGTLTKDPTTFLYGENSAKIALAATALNFNQVVTKTDYDGKRFKVSCDIKTSDNTIQLCSYDGTNEIECTDSGAYTGDDKWHELSASMVAGSAGNVGVKIKTSSITDDVFIDNCLAYESERVFDGGLDWPAYTSGLTITGSGGWATSSYFLRPYKTDKGWVLEGIIRGSVTPSAVANLVVTLPGITWENPRSSFSVRQNGTALCEGSINDGDANLNIDCNSATGLNFFMHFVGKITAMPTWARDITGSKVTTEPSQEAVSLSWYNVTNCQPISTATGFTVMNDTDCSFTSATKIGTILPPTTTGDIALKIPYVKPGVYEVAFDGLLETKNVSGTNCVFRLYDGTNVIGISSAYSIGAYEALDTVRGLVRYDTAQTNLEIKLESLMQGAGDCRVYANGTLYNMKLSFKPVEGFIKGSFSNYVETPQNDGSNKKPILVSAYITDGAAVGTVSEDDSDFINGNCANGGDVGNYSCTFTTNFWKAGTTPHCWAEVSSDNARTTRVLRDGTTSINPRFETGGGAGADPANFTLFCKGYKN